MKVMLKSLVSNGLIGAVAAHADPPPNVKVELSFLLGFVDGSP